MGNKTSDSYYRLADLVDMIMERGMTGGCSDLDVQERAVFTTEEWYLLNKKWHYMNNQMDGFDEITNHVMNDWAVIDLYHKIARELIDYCFSNN